MNKFAIVIVFTILVATTSTGCNNYKMESSNNNINTPINKTSKITLDDIKNNYNKDDKGNIVKVTSYKNYALDNNYALVEYQKENRNYFDFYNLETGDIDLMPIWETQTKLKAIVDENHILFISDGYHIESRHSGFPYIIECSRAKEDIDSKDDFLPKRIEKFLRIDENTKFGNGPESKITLLKSSMFGIDILFEPIDERELMFGPITLPNVNISYLQNGDQLILEIPETEIEEKCILESLNNNNENPFIKSIKLERTNDGTRITIDLKDTAKYYNVEEKYILKNSLTVLNLSFKTEVEYNEY